MKKRASLLSFLVVVFLVVWAMPVWAEKVFLTEDNISQLQGKWEGGYSAKAPGGTRYFRMEFEITNDHPLECVITWHRSMGNPPTRVEYKNCILERGKLLIQAKSASNWVLLSLHSKTGELKLEGDYKISSAGAITLEGSCYLSKK